MNHLNQISITILPTGRQAHSAKTRHERAGERTRFPHLAFSCSSWLTRSLKATQSSITLITTRLDSLVRECECVSSFRRSGCTRFMLSSSEPIPAGSLSIVMAVADVQEFKLRGGDGGSRPMSSNLLLFARN